MTVARSALGILLCLSSAAAAAQPAPPATGATNAPFWTGITTEPAFNRAMDARLDHARETLDRLVAVKGDRTIDNTL
ncbi:MAG TPA: hypothetical protein VHU82_05550, partial [Vicinamibacterales bacterium]|nr:hypothetical protein [Vicinamibacterales bacterium]